VAIEEERDRGLVLGPARTGEEEESSSFEPIPELEQDRAVALEDLGIAVAGGDGAREDLASAPSPPGRQLGVEFLQDPLLHGNTLQHALHASHWPPRSACTGRFAGRAGAPVPFQDSFAELRPKNTAAATMAAPRSQQPKR
jgi:hypothetical protein